VLRAQGLRVVPGLPFVLALPLVVASCHRARPRLPAPSAIREFVVPWVNAFPSDIALDSAGRVWFTDRLTHRIGRLDPATGEIVGYATPASKSAPYGFAAGPDGGLWFAESGAGRVGRVDPSDGSITEYPLPGVTRGPHLLTWSGRRL
jgi:virginiamycin B lyase